MQVQLRDSMSMPCPFKTSLSMLRTSSTAYQVRVKLAMETVTWIGWTIANHTVLYLPLPYHSMKCICTMWSQQTKGRKWRATRCSLSLSFGSTTCWIARWLTCQYWAASCDCMTLSRLFGPHAPPSQTESLCLSQCESALIKCPTGEECLLF